ncbi:MAG: hypothetical protein GYB64_01980 [Chloroflexi bacterium]|nr:hypothetical protein [Chloroflexota bacterium]
MCCFCNDMRATLTSHQIYGDRRAAAFIDTSGPAAVHILIIRVDESPLPEPDLVAMAWRMAQTMQEVYSVADVVVLLAERGGRDAHVHVLPRDRYDTLMNTCETEHLLLVEE